MASMVIPSSMETIWTNGILTMTAMNGAAFGDGLVNSD